ncbi:hypothetical protein FSU_0393 [Fibrobacter succinogenes subsp. succinogenes S85]|uniref:Uncharacterized protein n=1 Tax=Fibrobacter succinogenes (strain ATCC 19169 / S85) TaxID=59374 RepID=D9S5Y7_FIBSS|nr:hypothetical protein FSU_0393 [Fibrobacter succinogenes subsp. succinogenes S85]
MYSTSVFITIVEKIRKFAKFQGFLPTRGGSNIDVNFRLQRSKKFFRFISLPIYQHSKELAKF